MTRLVFAREPESVPYDLDGHLTAWRPATAYATWADSTAPYVGHRFTAGAGYVAEDIERALVGRDAVNVVAIVSIGADASGLACIVARGNGGATPDTYYGYEFGLDIGATEVRLYHAYQDVGGQVVRQELGATGRTPPGSDLVISWCREGDRLCGFVNGEMVGEVALAGAGTVMTLDTPMTVGCRATVSTHDRYFAGIIRYLEIATEAVTTESERHRYARLWSAPAMWADVAESLLLPLPGQNYRGIRRATMGAMFGAVAAELARAETCMSPTTAYGAALQRWEQATTLRPLPTETIAERQAAATSAIRSPGGFDVPGLRAYAADLMGVTSAEVDIVEGSNQFELPCTGDGLIPAPWRVTGTGYAHSADDGLYLHARVGDVLAFSGGNRHGVQLAVGVPHAPDSPRNSFFAVVDTMTGLSESQWAGVVLRTVSEVLWVAVIVSPDGKKWLAWRRVGVGLVTPWVKLAVLVGNQVTIGVAYDDGAWVALLGLARFPLVDAPVEWIGMALGADGALSSELQCRITRAQLICADAAVHWQWTAVCPEPVFTRDEHVALLNRRSRAVTRAFISRSPALRCNDPRSQLGRTPLPMITESSAHASASSLPENEADTYRILGMRPSHLFVYVGRQIVDRVGAIHMITANSSLMVETTGADGRPALVYDPLTFHYTETSGVIAFDRAGFAVSMVCKLDGTPGRVLSQWLPTGHRGFLLEYTTDSRLQLTVGSPDDQVTCDLQVDEHFKLDTWMALTIAVQRVDDRWHCILATPEHQSIDKLQGAEFTPSARLSINRWSSSLGTGLTCRWLGVFQGHQVGDRHTDDWPEFTRTIARTARIS